MKEFIEKLIGRLEEEKNKRLLFEDNATEEEAGWYFSGSRNGLADAISIVNQLAGEYINCSTDTSTDCSKCSRRSWYQKGCTDAEKKLAEEYKLFGNSEQVNNGWIPCGIEMPHEGQKVLACINPSIAKHEIILVPYEESVNCWHDGTIIAWQPLPAPYQPKGE